MGPQSLKCQGVGPPACLKHSLHESSNLGNSLPVANRVPIHQWMWIESTRVTIQGGGVHTERIQVESGLKPSCKGGLIVHTNVGILIHGTCS